MQDLLLKIETLESKLTGEFFEDLYLEQEIEYWKRQIPSTEKDELNIKE